MNKHRNRVKSYTVKVEIDFAVQATSIELAYKQFEKLIVELFHQSFKDVDWRNGEQPKIVPSYYEGLRVIRNDSP